MRRYETMFIASPELSDEDLQNVSDKLHGVIGGMKGRIIGYEALGKKRLAYDVKRQNRGYYFLMDFLGPPELVAEVERNLRLDDRILKYLSVKLADHVDPESIQAKERSTRTGEDAEESRTPEHPEGQEETA